MTQDDPSQPAPGEVTRLISASDREGGEAGATRLLEIVYDELRRLASAQMAREPAGPTLQPTALVHEAWVRLVAAGERTFEGRVHFFRTAALAMRRILVDRGRRAAVLRREDGTARISLDRNPSDATRRETLELDLAALERALSELEAFDPRLAEVVGLRWLTGLSVDETAAALDLSPRTVKRDWSVARAWLARRLEEANGEPA